MDKDLALRMLEVIEKMEAENFSLRAMLLEPHRTWSSAEIDRYLERLQETPGFQEKIRARWLPLRNEVSSGENLEAALQRFLQISPRPKDVN